MVLVRMGELGEQPVICQQASPQVDGTTYYCSLIQGHEGLHEAVGLGISWDHSHLTDAEGQTWEPWVTAREEDQ